MKNKLGFTLIELLGAMVILSLLSLITIPTVTKVVKNNKQKLYDTQIENIKSATQAWASDNLDIMPEKGRVITVSLKTLQKEGYVEKNIKNPKTGKKLENFDIYIRNIENQFIYNIGEEPSSTLITGSEFNTKLRKFIKDTHPDGEITSAENLVVAIFILSNGELPDGYTEEELLSLANIDISNEQDESINAYFNTNKRTVYIYSKNQIYANEDSSGMFSGFYSVDFSIELDVTQLDTSKVIDMSGMFANSNVKELDLSNFDTSNVTDMVSMFANCYKLTSLDLSSFDTSKVTDMSSMFLFTNNLTEIIVSDKWVINSDTITTDMFEYCGTDHVTVK